MSDDDRDSNNHQYKVSPRVMITALAFLFFIVVLVIFLHLYARRKLRRQVRRQAINRQLAFGAATMHAAQTQQEPPKAGLDPSVIQTLPVFAYHGGNASAGGDECAVCLSSMEEGEMARILPNCKHAFHQECIDMWLHSHSTCPICRTQAEPCSQVATDKAVAPSAPPLDPENSTSVAGSASTAKVGASSSLRLSSFRRMLSRERSSRRMQGCGQEEAMEDLERQ